MGDWFVNRVVVDRQPLLILVSSASLLPILEPARNMRTLPERLTSIVERRLRDLRIAEPLITAEIERMDEVLVAPTNDRSVVGTMVDFVHTVRFVSARYGKPPGETLSQFEELLEQTPCRAGRPQGETVFPADKTRELLALGIH